MKNSEYWKLRFAQLEEAQNKLANEGCKEIEGIYRQTLKEIEGKIDTWYRRLAKNNEISMAEARKFLSGSELKEFKWDVHDYIKYGKENAVSGQWMKQLENASAKFHISKYEALKIQTQQSFESLFAKQKGITSDTMAEVYKSGYYHTAFEIQKGFGIGWDISGIDQNQVEKVLAKPWAVDGKNFSERIWSNKEKLVSEVHNELTRNIITGADPQKAIDSIAKKMNTSKYNAGRLVMTEEAYFSSAAQKDCFDDLGVEEYEVVATLDSHTSDICRSMDGKHFPMSEYKAGVTAPPFHVFCRSTACPWFDEDFGEVGERAARDGDGKTYYVPADMNYREWEEVFVNGGDKSGFDVYSDGSGVHYKKHVEPVPKKEYLTKKKLQAKIADADVQIEDLENQFQSKTYGIISYQDFKKDYGGDYSAISHDVAEKSILQSIGNKMESLEAQKAGWQEKLNEKLKAEQKKSLVKQKIDLEKQKEEVQKQLDNVDVKTYSGIWKDDKTTADWINLNIKGKKDYYTDKLLTETDPDLKQKFQNLLNQVEELDVEGSNYNNVQQQLKKLEQEIFKVQSDLTKIENGDIINAVDNAFSQERKDAALWAKATKDADEKLRSVCGEVWKSASNAEKDAIYDYTTSYHKFNEPLRGIEYGPEKFLGVGNVDFDQIGVTYSGYKPGQVRKEINAMTDIIEKSTYDFDMWMQRGCDYSGMDKFFNIPMSKLQNASQVELKELLLKNEVVEYAFCSCGVSKGKGFSNKPIILNIYAPKGTQMMYAEPFSAFGNGTGRQWNGNDLQFSFGNEAEIILQQGTKFRITKIEKSNGKLYFDLEIIGQNPQR